MNAVKACLIVAGVGGAGATALCCIAGVSLLALSSSSSGASPTPTGPRDSLAALRVELDRELSTLYGAEVLSVELSNRLLTVRADLGPVDSKVRLESTGKILAVIGNHRPAADWIHIETPAGQRIRVKMDDLLDYTAGRIDMSQFMARWEVTKP